MNSNAQRFSKGLPLARIDEEAKRLLSHADQQHVTIRLLGGVAVALVVGEAMPAPLKRKYGDIDLVVRREHSRRLRPLLEELGYSANQRFNNLHGDRRLLFYDETNARQLDVFVGGLKMCHTLDLNERLDQSLETLLPADLLLTKLQIVEINRKDQLDAIALLAVCEVADDACLHTIDQSRLVDVTCHDWGWYTTLSDNLQRLRPLATDILPQPLADQVEQRIAAIERAIERAPKSMGWRIRAAVGRRVSWYELPEEVAR